MMDMLLLVLIIYEIKKYVSFQIFINIQVHYNAHCYVIRLLIGLVTQAVVLTLE